MSFLGVPPVPALGSTGLFGTAMGMGSMGGMPLTTAMPATTMPMTSYAAPMTSYAAPATTTFAGPATIAAPMTYARPATTYAAPITTSAPIRSAPMSYGTTVGAPMSYPSTLTSSVGLGAYGGVVGGYGGVRSYGAPILYGASYP